MKKYLEAIGSPRHAIDENGVVYGINGKVLTYQHTTQGYRTVVILGITYRIDRLMGLVFKGIQLDKKVQVLYEDDERSNVSIDNLKFVENT